MQFSQGYVRLLGTKILSVDAAVSAICKVECTRVLSG